MRLYKYILFFEQTQFNNNFVYIVLRIQTIMKITCGSKSEFIGGKKSLK